ncbi:hypothetical protein F66182_4159 [Fusarium sp. NRRL 66182]|nr:hypothetical protein F66182_4159 [Fusarium sp. NRRL 66182]
MLYPRFKLATVAVFAALLTPLVLGAAPPALQPSIKWETTTNDILLSEIGPFDLKSQLTSSGSTSGTMNKRSSQSEGVCTAIRFLPQTGGRWHFEQAWCDRTGTDVNTFRVDCFGGRRWVERLPKRQGACRKGEWCVDFHGHNTKGDPADDITCVNRKNIHTWVANTQTRPVEDRITCSSGWRNNYKQSAKATFEVDVMDSGGVNRIAPENVYYILNQQRIGVSRGNDAEVGSGDIIMPPGGSVQACVIANAAKNQVLNILGAVTSFALL